MDLRAEFDAIVPNHVVFLTTDRLYLRPVVKTDLQHIHKFRQNSNTMKFMHTSTETEEDPLKCYSFDRVKIMTSPGTFAFAVQLRSQEPSEQAAAPIIGFLGCFRPPATGYIFDEPYWGKGYATEAYRAFLDAYWQNFPEGLPSMKPEDRNVLYAHVYEGNRASARVLEKIGFTMIRQEPVDLQALGGKSIDYTFQIQRPSPVPLPASSAETIL